MLKRRVGITTKTTAIIVAAIILVVAGGTCAYYLTLPTKPSPGGTVKVGFSISLTGNFNVEGAASLNGMKTATQWLNSNGGIIVNGKSYNMTLDYTDDASQTSNIVPLYTKLVQQDNAQFLLAPYSSGLTAAAAPIAEQFGTIMLSHGGSADSIWRQGYKNVFEVLSPASTYLRVAIDWLKANHPSDKLAVIYAGDSFSTTAALAAINYSKAQGFQVVYQSSYPTTVNDVTPQLTAAKSAGADDLLGGGHFNDGLLLAKQLAQVGWTPKFISLLVAVTEPTFQQQLGTAANLVTGPSQWEHTVAYTSDQAKSLGLDWFGPTVAQFTQLYQQVSGGKTPTYHSGEAAGTIFVLAKAIQSANSFDTTSVKQVLSSLNFMSFFGQFQVDQTGKQTAHSMVLVQWQNGVLKVVYPTTVAETQPQYPYGA